MIDLDQMCRKAMKQVRAVIRNRTADAHEAVRLDFERARRARQLPPIAIFDWTYYKLPPRFTCPECGDRLYFEVDEWSTSTGIPTPGGIRIMCQAEEKELARAMAGDRDPEWQHLCWQSDWQPVHDQVERWAASRVRVYR